MKIGQKEKEKKDTNSASSTSSYRSCCSLKYGNRKINSTAKSKRDLQSNDRNVAAASIGKAKLEKERSEEEREI